MARTYKRDSRGRFASGGGGSSGGSKGGGKRKAAATTSARGRALTNQRRATEAVRAGRGGNGPSKKAVRSAVTAMRARAYYASTGTGTKRSAKRAVSAAAKRKQIRTEIGAKRKEAGERAAGRPKARVVAGKGAKAPVKVSKVDLTDTGFTRRLGRAKALLRRAQANYAARGSSVYDTAARRRVQTLESAVSSLSYARKTVRNATVPASKIKTTDRTIIDNYNRQLAATKRRAASTPSGGRKTTAPKLTRSEKAAATRARNKAARDAEQRRRWEQSRR